jgi:hypothetical protein
VVAVILTIGLDYSAGVKHATCAIELSAGQSDRFLGLAKGARAFGLSVLGLQPGANPGMVEAACQDISAAQASARSVDSLELSAIAHLLCAWARNCLSDLPAAIGHWTELHAIADRTQEPSWFLPLSLAGLSVSQHLLDKPDDAMRSAKRMLALPSLRDTPLSLVRSLAVEFAPVLVAGGQHEAANQVLRDAADDVRRIAIRLADSQVLIMSGIAEHLRGRSHRAAQLLAASRLAKGAERWAGFSSPTSAALYLHYLPLVRDALGPDVARRARDEGQAMTLDEALIYAVEGLD